MVAPDGDSVVIGGSFTSVNGSATRATAWRGSTPRPARAAARRSTRSIRNGGAELRDPQPRDRRRPASTASGYHFGGGGNLEGTFSAELGRRRSMNWVEDCHGDTYSVFPTATSSTPPATRTTAATRAASRRPTRGRSTAAPRSTKDAAGRQHRATSTATRTTRASRAPTILQLVPDDQRRHLHRQSARARGRSPATATTSLRRRVHAGQRPGQQGLVRFADPSIAPNTQGPRLSGRRLPAVGDVARVRRRSGCRLARQLGPRQRDADATTCTATSRPRRRSTRDRVDPTFWNRQDHGLRRHRT